MMTVVRNLAVFRDREYKMLLRTVRYLDGVLNGMSIDVGMMSEHSGRAELNTAGANWRMASSVCGARLAIDIHGWHLAHLNTTTSQHGMVVNGKKLPESPGKYCIDAIWVCNGGHSKAPGPLQTKLKHITIANTRSR